MTLGINSRDLNIRELMAPGVRLSMPPYQRSYSWGERESTALLQDLMDAADLEELHFIGAIVVNTNGAFDSLEIVDGQQRLTTITMLLCILRDLESDPAISADIQTLISDPPNPDLGEPETYRVTLNQLDMEFFRDRIQAPGAAVELAVTPELTLSGSQKRMAVAAEAISSVLTQMDAATRRSLVDTILQRCALVCVNVDNRDRGYQVYRVLNTRGREPNAHDIIKTELFEAARFDRDDADAYSTKWTEYEAQLGSSTFDDLLRQVRALYDRNPKGDLVTGFKRSVLSKVTAREFLEDLLPKYVTSFENMTTGRMGAEAVARGVNDYLNRLRALDHGGWRAPALKFLVERGVTDPASPAFFWRLERLGYITQLIINKRDQRDRRYRRVVEAMEDDERLFDPEGPLEITADDAKKVRERLLGRFATFNQRRAMALRLNAALEGGCTLPPEADATVEHVLPRNPDPDSMWLTTWPDATKRRELCDTLGNFVLLTHEQNQSADRKDYRHKHKIYFDDRGQTPFALTRDLSDQFAWTADIVRERTQSLGNILAQHWELP